MTNNNLEGSKNTIKKEASKRWWQAFRPLVWWFILVLLMFGHRTHERLMEQTRLEFSVRMEGQTRPFEGHVSSLDDTRVASGNHIALGWHLLNITHPRHLPVTTNFFVWYGGKNLGEITLEREKGVLSIDVHPPASVVRVKGPEYDVMLTNSAGMASTVPTDIYTIEVKYPLWEKRETTIVGMFGNARVDITAPFGGLEIVCNQSDATFEVWDDQTGHLFRGVLPVLLTNLPERNYRVNAKHHGNEQRRTFSVRAGSTNTVTMDFKYGVAVIETIPPGATVSEGQKDLGQTPLTLDELLPGDRRFRITLTDYEPISPVVQIVSGETNILRVNLISQFYTRALESARISFTQKNYDRAAESAAEALKYKEGDEEALKIRRESIGWSHLTRAETLGKRQEFGEAIKALTLALPDLPATNYAHDLLVEFKRREDARIEAERKRQAELAEQERKRREAEEAEQRAQGRLREIRRIFDGMLGNVPDAGQFAEREIVTTKSAEEVGNAIMGDFTTNKPLFRIVQHDRRRSDLFALHARQLMLMAYRDCFMVAEEIRDKETRILFKVVEYDHLPELKILGGVLTARVVQQDPTGARADAFRKQILEGASMVQERIQRAVRE